MRVLQPPPFKILAMTLHLPENRYYHNLNVIYIYTYMNITFNILCLQNLQ